MAGVQDFRKFILDFEELRMRVRQLFEERVSAVYGGGPTSSGEWTPAVDVYETPHCIHLVAEVAGVKLEDIKIEVLGNVLTLKGLRPFGREGVTPENYQRMEGSFGSFERSFTLPYQVEEEGVEATLCDGVLKVTLPCSDCDEGREIKVGKG